MKIIATEKFGALAKAKLARAGWAGAVCERLCGGWGLVTVEKHRVALVRGSDLVFFAPEGADFDAPTPLSVEDHSRAQSAARDWAAAHRGA